MKKILHIQSFYGNPGDYLNWVSIHETLLNQHKDIYIEKKEIRKSYLNYNGEDKWAFESSLFDQYDKVLIGGGAMLEIVSPELRWGHSINLDFLDSEVNKKIVIFSQSFDIRVPVSLTFKKNILYFYDLIFKNEIPISFRIDGSHERLDLFSNSEVDVSLIDKVVDFGYIQSNLLSGKKYNKKSKVILSISDQYMSEKESSSAIIKSVEIINILINRDIAVTIIPHLITDIIFYAKIISMLDERIRRSPNFKVLTIGNDGETYDSIINEYLSAKICITSRYHSIAFCKLCRVYPITFYSPSKVRSLHKYIPNEYISIEETDVNSIIYIIEEKINDKFKNSFNFNDLEIFSKDYLLRELLD